MVEQDYLHSSEPDFVWSHHHFWVCAALEKQSLRASLAILHRGMIHGWKSPQKRRGKEKRLPNVKPRPYDYRIAPSGDGQFYFMAPYPPRVNRTIDPYPHGDKNKWPTKVHKKYPMRWKNIEYIYEPRLQRKPFANGHQRWTGPVTRIEHVGKKKTIKSLVTHDARLLDWS